MNDCCVSILCFVSHNIFLVEWSLIFVLLDLVSICKIFYEVHLGAWNSLWGAAGHESRDCSARLYDWVAVVNKTDHINLHFGVFALLCSK